jgi:undecaprenyl diphosphate synthase
MSQAAKVAGSPVALTKVPRHVGIIMDGNGRWASEKGLPRTAGHRAGADNLRRIVGACAELGIEILTVFAFSTENWERPESEVRGLMWLVNHVIETETEELHRNGVCVRHIGDASRLSDDLRAKITRATQLTRDNERLIVNVAFNYGGRAEIVSAVRRMMRDGIAPQEVDEALISSYLDTAGLPDPDLIIRTSGEMRLSNFLVWQAAYAEYYSTPTYWPDFDEHELRRALIEFGSRKRRFGRVSSQT